MKIWIVNSFPTPDTFSERSASVQHACIQSTKRYLWTIVQQCQSLLEWSWVWVCSPLGWKFWERELEHLYQGFQLMNSMGSMSLSQLVSAPCTVLNTHWIWCLLLGRLVVIWLWRRLTSLNGLSFLISISLCLWTPFTANWGIYSVGKP